LGWYKPNFPFNIRQ
jgi:hypothetical protein